MAPILHHPDPHVLFVVEVDASTTGVGAVLSQQISESPRLHHCSYCLLFQETDPSGVELRYL